MEFLTMNLHYILLKLVYEFPNLITKNCNYNRVQLDCERERE
jgi:hypothetical protein